MANKHEIWQLEEENSAPTTRQGPDPFLIISLIRTTKQTQSYKYITIATNIAICH